MQCPTRPTHNPPEHNKTATRAAAVREAFVRLHDEGLVYKGAYLVNWSPSLQTAVSDLEVEPKKGAGPVCAAVGAVGVGRRADDP